MHVIEVVEMANGDKLEVMAIFPKAISSRETEGWVIRAYSDLRIVSGRPTTSAQLAWKSAWLIARNPQLAVR
jgi:hypothetical protein